MCYLLLGGGGSPSVTSLPWSAPDWLEPSGCGRGHTQAARQEPSRGGNMRTRQQLRRQRQRGVWVRRRVSTVLWANNEKKWLAHVCFPEILTEVRHRHTLFVTCPTTLPGHVTPHKRDGRTPNRRPLTHRLASVLASTLAPEPWTLFPGSRKSVGASFEGADYYSLVCLKSLSISCASLPPPPPALASSAVWSMGPGQVAKRVEPNPPSTPTPRSPCPRPSRRPPVQLCRSPQVSARSDVQHGDNMFARHRCSRANDC